MGLFDIVAKVAAEAAEEPVPEPEPTVITKVDQPAAAVGGGGGGITVGGGGGGITVGGGDRPIFSLPSLEDIQIVPAVGGVISGVGKLGAVALGGVAGFLGGLIFGGGGSQEQQQEITQDPDVTVTPIVTPDMPVDVDVDPTIQTLLDFITKQQLALEGGEIDIGAGAVITGDIGTSEITNITNTYPTSINIQKTITETYPTMITTTITKTSTVTSAGQEAAQEQGLDLLGIAAVAIAGIIGISILKKKKIM